MVSLFQSKIFSFPKDFEICIVYNLWDMVLLLGLRTYSNKTLSCSDPKFKQKHPTFSIPKPKDSVMQ